MSFWKRNKGKLIIIAIILIFVCVKRIPRIFSYTYTVEMRLIPIKDCDYMQIEGFIKSLNDYKKNQNTENKKVIDSLSRYLVFGDRIRLVDFNESWGKTKHEIIGSNCTYSNHYGFLEFEIQDIKTINNIPVVNTKSIFPVKPNSVIECSSISDKVFYTRETKNWPVNNPRIQKIKEKIIDSSMNEKQKVRSIIDWVLKNIKRGNFDGTRYGPINVLDRGYGRCWDYSDMFITLSRAAGIPARQVLGFVYEKGGHAWSQIYLDGVGWISIDPELKKMGVPNHFIPLSISDDGDISFLYYERPIARRSILLFSN